MKILVTGGAGYLGSVLIPKLLVRGHKVRIVDVGYFGVAHLRSLRPGVELIREDIRRVCKDKGFCRQLIDGIDCVIQLAAVSNDPSAELCPELTEAVNVRAITVVAEACRARGIRLIFSSSCSVYGQSEKEADEKSSLKPLTVYAKSKVKAEKMLNGLATAKWSPVILRNGTLFGYSPRMRFDLVVNIMSLYCALYNEIKIFGKGNQWRPFLHVTDCARAIIHFAEKKNLRYRCYNISHENLQVSDLIEIFKRINPKLTVSHIKNVSNEERDYRVSTRRMLEEGFRTRVSVAYGAEEIVDAIISGLIQDPESIYYRNVKWLKELTEIGTKEHKEIVALMETLARVHALH